MGSDDAGERVARRIARVASITPAGVLSGAEDQVERIASLLLPTPPVPLRRRAKKTSREPISTLDAS